MFHTPYNVPLFHANDSVGARAYRKKTASGKCISQADQLRRNAHDVATQHQHVTVRIRPNLNASDRVQSIHTSSGPELPGPRISEIPGAMRIPSRISQGLGVPECDWRCAGMNGENVRQLCGRAGNEALRTKSTRQ